MMAFLLPHRPSGDIMIEAGYPGDYAHHNGSVVFPAIADGYAYIAHLLDSDWVAIA